MVGVPSKSIIDVLSLVLLQLAFYGVLKQKDSSIPSQVPGSSTTRASGMCLPQADCSRGEDEEEPKVLCSLIEPVSNWSD